MAGRVLVFIMGALACALMFAPTSTALGPLFNVRVAKEKDGPYAKVIKVKVDKNEKVELWYRVKNVSPGPLELGFDDAGTKIPEDLSIKWFKGKTDISHDVQTAGYDFSTEPGQIVYFRAKVRADKHNIKHCVIGRGNFSDLFYDAGYGGVNDNCAT